MGSVLDTFLGTEEAAQVPQEEEDEQTVAPPPRNFTKAELKLCDGLEGRPLYLGADGRVFDVGCNASGRENYGPGGSYNLFVSHDVSFALATMQLDSSKWKDDKVSDLTSTERMTLADWVSKFEGKYHVAGYLNDGAHPMTVQEATGKSVAEHEADWQEKHGEPAPPKLPGVSAEQLQAALEEAAEAGEANPAPAEAAAPAARGGGGDGSD